MRQWVVQTGAGIDGIHLTDADVPVPGPGEVRVKLKAASINARDFQMTEGGGIGSRRRRSSSR